MIARMVQQPMTYADGYRAGYEAAQRDAIATLRKAHQAALDVSKPGRPVTCSVCERPHSSYRRKLNSAVAAVLVKIYRLGGGPAQNWVNVAQMFPNTTHRGGEWTIAKHWGLVMPRDVRDGGANSPGDWRLTPLGVAFVEGRVEVPRYVELRDGVCLGKSEETISITGSLGNAFNYAELLRGEG